MVDGIEEEPIREPTSPINEDGATIESRYLERSGNTRRADLNRRQEEILSTMEELDERIKETTQGQEPDNQVRVCEKIFWRAKPNAVLGRNVVDWSTPLSVDKPYQGYITRVFTPQSGEFSQKGVYIVQHTREGEEGNPNEDALSVVIINPKLTEGKDPTKPSFAFHLNEMIERRTKFDPQTLTPKRPY